MRGLSALVREPLVQFLAIGAVVAGIYGLVPRPGPGPAPVPAAQETIVVTPGRIAQLADLFERSWQRPPTDEELDGLVRSFVREEVLYRAGRALGLDQDDTVVRRRVAQKMEFLMEPAPDEIAPTEADLARYLADNRARFREPSSVAFRQVFIDPTASEEPVAAVAAGRLAALAGGAAPETVSDPSLLPPAVEMGPAANVERLFGPAFTAALFELPVGVWSGPVRSAFGAHLVRIEAVRPARDPALAAVREAVRRELLAERRRSMMEERIEGLKERYRIVIEEDKPAPDEDARGARAPAGAPTVRLAGAGGRGASAPAGFSRTGVALAAHPGNDGAPAGTALFARTEMTGGAARPTGNGRPGWAAFAGKGASSPGPQAAGRPQPVRRPGPSGRTGEARQGGHGGTAGGSARAASRATGRAPREVGGVWPGLALSMAGPSTGDDAGQGTSRTWRMGSFAAAGRSSPSDGRLPLGALSAPGDFAADRRPAGDGAPWGCGRAATDRSAASAGFFPPACRRPQADFLQATRALPRSEISS